MTADPSRSNGPPWGWILGGITIAALAAAWYFLPVEDWAAAFDEWIRRLGFWGGAAFAAAYVVATVLLVPAWPLTVVAGLAYGVLIGFPLVLVSATAGATLAFLVSRYVLRRQVEKKTGERKLFKAIDRAITEQGWRVVGLLRLSPLVPFNLQNYLYGVTGISLAHYVAASFVGMMPGTLMYVYLGAAGKAVVGDGGDTGTAGALKWSLFGAGLIATMVVAVMVTRRARQELDKIIDQEEKPAGGARS